MRRIAVYCALLGIGTAERESELATEDYDTLDPDDAFFHGFWGNYAFDGQDDTAEWEHLVSILGDTSSNLGEQANFEGFGSYVMIIP